MNRLYLLAILAFHSTHVQPRARGLCEHPVLSAHRGAAEPGQYENSVSNIEETLSEGIPIVEVDLAESRDRTIYLLHDRTLDRTTDMSGPIHDLTDQQLADVRLTSPQTGNHLVGLSTFEDLLRSFSSKQARIMVDVKDTPLKDVIGLITRYRMISKVILLTFDDRTAQEAYEADRNVLVSVFVRTEADLANALIRARGHPIAIYVAQDAIPEVFISARAAGKLVISDSLGSLDEQLAGLIKREGGIRRQRPDSVSLARWISTHPTDILVTNFARQLQIIEDCRTQ